MMTPATYEDLFARLEQDGIRYVTVSGVAVVLRGHIRPVADLDIVVDPAPQEAQRTMQTLLRVGFVPSIPLPLSALTVLRMFDATQREVDVFVRYPIPFDELWANAEPLRAGGSVARVVSLEHLLRAKRFYGRPHDLQDIEGLLALPGREPVIDAPQPGAIRVTLRPARETDADFLRWVYASTRAEELAATDWNEEQKAQFCQHQFTAQDAHYRKHYPTAEFSVIEHGGVAIGRLYVDRWPREIRIMDLTLLPDWRGKGIGTELLRGLLEEARGAGKALSIHVEKFNPARRLYERLGLAVKEDKGVYLLMEWRES
jgi:GNAT superfamily N-acetyltransferase